MYTYQDLLEIGEGEKIEYLRQAIINYCGSKEYVDAEIAENYYKRRNVTIMDFQKLLYTVTGKAIPDNYSANFKLRSNWFPYFVLQLNQYLLSNGVTWKDDSTKDKLGKNFDKQLKKAGRNALTHNVCYGFWNFDHLEVFTKLEFCPFYDEENGALSAGIRFWQIDPTKPLRATFYELDGITELIWRKGQAGEVLKPKHAYTKVVRRSDIDGTEIYDGQNYPTFPIVPLWGINRQSELEGRRESIDCYDLIKSGFANTVDEASYIYWAIQGAGGMKDMDLAKFVERMKTLHAAIVEDEGAKAEPNQIEAPYASREALLDRLAQDLHRDFMALDINNIANGADTATQIKAAYELLDEKASDYEDSVFDFLDGVLAVAGIDEDPTLTRSKIVNTGEEITNILQAADTLSPDYVTRKILTLLGDGDLADDIIKERDAEDMERINIPPAENSAQPQEEEQPAANTEEQ